MRHHAHYGQHSYTSEDRVKFTNRYNEHFGNFNRHIDDIHHIHTHLNLNRFQRFWYFNREHLTYLTNDLSIPRYSHESHHT